MWGFPHSIFCPYTTQSDVAIAEHFGLATIQQNECGKRAASAKTVFFMPHCGRTLYQNVLASNWGEQQQQLRDIAIIGNRCVMSVSSAKCSHDIH